MPGLDGLRAVAVLGVLAYHLNFDWIPGGFLGVSVFFTLSGYLITDLILGQMREGKFKLPSFWLARARRLLPAMFLLLIVVSAWVTTIGPRQGPEFREAAATAALYVNNWWLVFRDISYFEQFAAPGPFNHLWSLAVEEQFYLFWPFLVMGGVAVIPERRSAWIRPRFALATLGVAAASAVLMAALYEPGLDPSRVYYGTDSRAAEMLVGAALAAVWPSQRISTQISAQARNVIDGVGLAGLGVIAIFFLRAEEFSSFMYRGGFAILSFAVAAVVAAVAHPASRLGPLLGTQPMKWIGERSYGIYLWHFPIIVLTASATWLGPDPVRITVQVAATLVISALSWKYFEDPIRRGAIGRIWNRLRSGTFSPQQVFAKPANGVALLAAVVIAIPATAGFAGVGIEEATQPGDDEITVVRTVTVEPETTSTIVPESSPTTALATTPTTTLIEDALGPCTEVVHVGGSTSLGLIRKRWIFDESQQIPAQYARVGITTSNFDIIGGRAIYEGFREEPPARWSAQEWRDAGFSGCWVFALGTMDAANVEIAGPSLDERVDIMMDIAAGEPVLWVNVKTVKDTGPWRSELMPAMNEALLRACDRYDNLRIYDWALDVQDDWWEEDGIHPNEEGSVERARRIPDALVKAFPGSAATADTPTAGDGCLFALGDY